MKTHSALVGMHFRPPAKAVLASLPQGAELKLMREPFNEHDIAAVAVWVRIAQVPKEQYSLLELAAQGHGFSLDEVLARSEHQLGYIASVKLPKGMEPNGLSMAPAIAFKLDASPAPGYTARLVFDTAGRPIVEIDWSQGSE